MKFDLLIKGGEVIDPGGGQSGRLDVAIKRNRIAALDRDIPAESAARVIHAGGQYVTPGLIDLHTHVYHHVTFWGIDPDPVAARSGVTTWLDVGSAGAFNWPGFREFIVKPAEALINAGYKPDVISSDIHQLSIHGPLFDMPTCLSKFLALGMSFPDVIRAATARPAEVLGLQHELGTLNVGALADLALFTIQPGRFPFYDVFMNMREGTQLIRNTLTIINGRPLPRTPDAAPAPWIELSEGQRALLERGHTPDAFAK